MIEDGTHEIMSLQRGSGNMYLRGQLKIGHAHSNPMFTVNQHNGDTMMQGDLQVGGPNIEGPRKVSIVSKNDRAEMNVIAGGQTNATLKLRAPQGQRSLVTLEEMGGNTYHMMNDAPNNKFVIRDARHELMGVTSGSGNTRIRGDLTVGGHEIGAPGARHMTVKANGGAATFNLVAGGTGNAEIKLHSPAGQKAIISMNQGPEALNIAHRGDERRLVIDDGKNVLMGISRDTGNTYIRGQLKVGKDPAKPMFVAESYNGNTLMQGDLTVGGTSVQGTRSMTLKSFDSKASFSMIAGTNSDAHFSMEAPAGKNNIIDMTEGDHTIRLKHDGPLDSFVISDGTNTLLSTARSTGNTFVKGVLAVGNITSDWIHMRCVVLSDSVDVSNQATGVSSWASSGGMTKGACKQACDQTSVCTNAIWNGATCSIRGGNAPGKIPATQVCGATSYGYSKGQAPSFYTAKTGDTSMQGNLVIGGEQVPGNRLLNIETSAGDASLNVKAGATGTAQLNMEAAAGKDVSIDMATGPSRFQILNKGAHDRLEINDGTNALLAVSRLTGNTEVRGELKVGDSTDPVFRVEGSGINGRAKIKGDLTVGGETVQGEKKITVQSQDSAASFNVISGGNKDAAAVIMAPAGADAWMELGENGGSRFRIVNDGKYSDGLLHISDNTNKLFAMKPLSGDSYLKGSLDVGNKVEVRRSLKVGGTTGNHNITVQSYDGDSDMTIKSQGTGTATLRLQSPKDVSAGVSFIEQGGKQFHILNRGDADALVINDGADDLVKIYPQSGNMWIKGSMEVGSHTTVKGSMTVYGDIYEHCEGHRWTAGNKHCYKHFPTALTFDNARKACMRWKGHLATLTSAEENEFVKQSITWSSAANNGLWLGYSDAFRAQLKFQWITGEVAVSANGAIYENWNSAPQDAAGNKDCARLTNDGKWHETSCGDTKQFVCEKDM
jgi:hypothetical protein